MLRIPLRRYVRLLLAGIVLSAFCAPALPGGAETVDDIHKIKHIIIIMQENRSFDSYFGTFPGADGIPMRDGVPTVCVPDMLTHSCVRPYHDLNDQNAGGPHDSASATRAMDGGKMDGFINIAESAWYGCSDINAPNCDLRGQHIDVMGYHTDREIPNYWAYAKSFVLQDHLFESILNWSLAQHLFMVSEWNAKCTIIGDPMSCSASADSDWPRDMLKSTHKPIAAGRPDYPWTDLTYLLHRHHVSWAYYVMDGFEPDCEDDSASCNLKPQTARTPGIWNPLPSFDDVKQDHELGNIKDTTEFFADLKSNQLPSVVWITPSNRYSEHPTALVSTGQAYVTGLINAIMQSPEWNSSAIFLSWDDWGGFYDHERPPSADSVGYGIRVPGLVISPYARRGYIDHQILSHDAYTKFIEDDFLDGERLDPKTDGRPDPRPEVPESLSILGDLRNDFDFGQTPRAPMILPGAILPPYLPGDAGPP